MITFVILSLLGFTHWQYWLNLLTSVKFSLKLEIILRKTSKTFLYLSQHFYLFHKNRVSSCLNPFPMLFLVPCRRFYWLYIAQSNTFLTKFLQILVFQNFQFFGKLSISRIWLIFVFIKDYQIAIQYFLWVYCSMNNRV